MEKHLEKICKKFFETDLEWCDLISDAVLLGNSKTYTLHLQLFIFYSIY